METFLLTSCKSTRDSPRMTQIAIECFIFDFLDPHKPLKRGNLDASCVQFTHLKQTTVHKTRFKTIFLTYWSLLIKACLLWAKTGC